MKERIPFLINGKECQSSELLTVIDPYNKEVIGEVYLAGANDLKNALQAALAAFKKTKILISYERSEILIKIADVLALHRLELIDLIIKEAGKPRKYATDEVSRAISTFTIAAEEAKRIGGEIIPLDLAATSKGRIGLVRRFPIGVILAISPFNFPLNLVAHKVAPAIAVGNTVVLKPSSQTPLTALLLGKICTEAGLPSGALNVVPCPGSRIEVLVKDTQIKMVDFTGSAGVGWHIKSIAGKKKVVLELGGNAAAIVEPETNLDFAIPRLVTGSFAYAGQVCISVQRIFIHNSIYEEFKNQFLKETEKKALVGDPNKEDTMIGPMIDSAETKRVLSWVKEALEVGAKVLTGNERNSDLIQPTVLENVNPTMKVWSEEIFGPVVILDRYETFKEAIAKVNNSNYGLQAGVFTNNLAKAFQAYRELEVGGVIINDYPTYRIDHMPYGGVKDSGFGREGLKYAIEEMTELKLMAINLENS